MSKRLNLETEVCDMPRRVATLIETFHGHDNGGLNGDAFGQVATLIVDLEHAADRLKEAFDDAPGAAKTKPDRDRDTLDYAITDLKGDWLLFEVALEKLERIGTLINQAERERGVKHVPYDEDLLEALSRGRLNLTADVRELEKAFDKAST